MVLPSGYSSVANRKADRVKKNRGLVNLLFISDPSSDYPRTYVNAEEADVPGFSVFTRRDGVVFHFYTAEMRGAMADPGQDLRGLPDPRSALADVGTNSGRPWNELVP